MAEEDVELEIRGHIGFFDEIRRWAARLVDNNRGISPLSSGPLLEPITSAAYLDLRRFQPNTNFASRPKIYLPPPHPLNLASPADSHPARYSGLAYGYQSAPAPSTRKSGLRPRRFSAGNNRRNRPASPPRCRSVNRASVRPASDILKLGKALGGGKILAAWETCCLFLTPNVACT